MKAIKITTDCKTTVIDLQEPLHRTIRGELGGWLEIVRPKRVPFPLTMIVDEEGLCKGLPFNPIGGFMYGTDLHDQPIVGDIIIMKETMTSDGVSLIGLDDQEIDDLVKWFMFLSTIFVSKEAI